MIWGLLPLLLVFIFFQTLHVPDLPAESDTQRVELGRGILEKSLGNCCLRASQRKDSGFLQKSNCSKLSLAISLPCWLSASRMTGEQGSRADKQGPEVKRTWIHISRSH